MTRTNRVWTAALVIIGDEILSGRTQDANLAYLGKWLNIQGIRLAEARVVADDMAMIGDAVNACRVAHDYVFTTGGIGPTHDDISVDAVARAIGRSVIMHPGAEAMLRGYYGAAISDAQLRMARVPDGAELIDNPVSGAPGIRIENIFMMAGVPKITQGMLAGLEGKLEGGAPVLDRTIGAWVAESQVSELLDAVEKQRPGIQIGSYPFWRRGRVGANFVIRSQTPNLLDDAARRLVNALADAGHTPIDGGI